MLEFKAESKDNFGILGLISHIFISLGALIVIVGLFTALFAPEAESIGILFGVGGGSVLGGLALGFLNIFL